MPERDESTPQDIQTLRNRYDALLKKQTQADTRLEEANRQLEQLKAEAREKYGTDDIEQLEKKLREMEASNLSKRAEYQKLLDKIEADLRNVEQCYEGTQSRE